MQPRDDTDDIAFDRWGQLQLQTTTAVVSAAAVAASATKNGHLKLPLVSWNQKVQQSLQLTCAICLSNVPQSPPNLLLSTPPLVIIAIHAAAICN